MACNPLFPATKSADTSLFCLRECRYREILTTGSITFCSRFLAPEIKRSVKSANKGSTKIIFRFLSTLFSSVIRSTSLKGHFAFLSPESVLALEEHLLSRASMGQSRDGTCRTRNRVFASYPDGKKNTNNMPRESPVNRVHACEWIKGFLACNRFHRAAKESLRN